MENRVQQNGVTGEGHDRYYTCTHLSVCYLTVCNCVCDLSVTTPVHTCVMCQVQTGVSRSDPGLVCVQVQCLAPQAPPP